MSGAGLIVTVMVLVPSGQTPNWLDVVHFKVLVMGTAPAAGEGRPLMVVVGELGFVITIAEADASRMMTLSNPILFVFPSFRTLITICISVFPEIPVTDAVPEVKFPE